MDNGEYSVNTACVVADFVNYRIQKAGFDYQTSPTQNWAAHPVTSAMRELCMDFEKRYGKQFEEMVNASEGIGMDSKSYFTVLNELLENDLNWGRVVAVFAFAGAMAVRCMRENTPEKVDLVRDWTCEFMRQYVDKWVAKNNGWKGLVEFFDNGKPKKKGSGWGELFVGAVGAVCIGALVLNKA